MPLPDCLSAKIDGLCLRGDTAAGNTDNDSCPDPPPALSPDAVEHLVAKRAATAATACHTLAAKHVTPHALRHSAAMALLHAGVDISVIAFGCGFD